MARFLAYQELATCIVSAVIASAIYRNIIWRIEVKAHPQNAVGKVEHQ